MLIRADDQKPHVIAVLGDPDERRGQIENALIASQPAYEDQDDVLVGNAVIGSDAVPGLRVWTEFLDVDPTHRPLPENGRLGR